MYIHFISGKILSAKFLRLLQQHIDKLATNFRKSIGKFYQDKILPRMICG
jgi:hypothetical protein